MRVSVRKPNPSGSTSGAAVRAAAREGAPLPATTRSHFEARLGHDFSRVRVHADDRAADAARAVRARAYTVGCDIVFGAGEYAPATAEGRRLLAHELVHVVQQAGAPTVRRRDIGAANGTAETEAARAADAVSNGTEPRVSAGAEPACIHRSPLDPMGTEAMHEDLIEDYRAAHGLPPHGIDPTTGRQEGPTDAEIRFGPLDLWVRGKAGVPAPAKAPKLVEKAPRLAEAARDDVRTFCRDLHKHDDNKDQDKYHACRRHRDYVLNILPQAVANIRTVASPYSEAIAKMYDSALSMAKYTWEPRVGGPSVSADGHPGTLTFGATTHKFQKFALGFHQRYSDAEGAAQQLGNNGFMIDLNEATENAALQNLPAIEDMLVHEATHVFMWVVEANKAARAAGTAPVDTNLDRASYGALESRLESAVLPLVTRIQRLPSFSGTPSDLSARLNAAVTASKLVAETIGFTEGGIFSRQRAGKEFSAAELTVLPPFLYSFAYWQTSPRVDNGELTAFLEANRVQIEKDVKPIILEIGEKYLSLRP